MRNVFLVLSVFAVLVVVVWWRFADNAYVWQLPDDIPLPVVPADNPITHAKVELGRWLFYDARLSGNKTMSCASCHIQALAFTDGRTRSIGSTGEIHPRSSMSLVNVAYASRLTWANPLLDRLEDQALTPLLGDDPVEMGLGSKPEDFATLLETEARYKALAERAFPNDDIPYSLLNGVRAISTFVRTIVGFESPYDRYIRGDDKALGDAAIRGMELFFSEELECFHCHGGFNFSDSTTHADARVEQVGYHNTGLYNVGGEGNFPADNTGLYDMTGERRDMGRFKAPSLRNIAVTAPYMHDGSVATLDDAIDHYQRGGRLIEQGENAGDGRLSPYKSEFIRGFDLTSDERHDLLEFLRSLTDPVVLSDEQFSNPFLD